MVSLIDMGSEQAAMDGFGASTPSRCKSSADPHGWDGSH